MRAVAAFLRGGAVPDAAVHDDQRRAGRFGLERLERPGQQATVVRVVNVSDVPAQPGELGGDVIAERQPGAALDGDLVVVVDPAEIVQLQVSSQGRRLLRDAFHHAAVPAKGVHVEVDEVEPWSVELRRLPLRRDRHPHAGGIAGAQRTGGALHPGGPPVLRVARTLRVQLAERPQVLQRHGRLTQRLVLRVHRTDAAQVKQCVEQRRGVPGRQHEPVPVRPDRQPWVEPQELLPQRVGHRRQRHRRSWMAGVRRLHRIDRQGTDGGDRELIRIGDRNRAAHAGLLPSRAGCKKLGDEVTAQPRAGLRSRRARPGGPRSR